MERGRFCYFSLLRSGRVSWFYSREGTETRRTNREGGGSGGDVSRDGRERGVWRQIMRGKEAFGGKMWCNMIMVQAGSCALIIHRNLFFSGDPLNGAKNK